MLQVAEKYGELMGKSLDVLLVCGTLPSTQGSLIVDSGTQAVLAVVVTTRMKLRLVRGELSTSEAVRTCCLCEVKRRQAVYIVTYSSIAPPGHKSDCGLTELVSFLSTLMGS